MALIKKITLAEQALKILSGGTPTPDTEITLQELLLFVNQSFASVVKRFYFLGRNEGEIWINGNIIYDFEQAVSKDTSKGLYYADVPATGVTLPYDMEIYQVSPTKDQNNTFVPVPNGFSGLYNGLEAGRLEGRIGYYLENGRIYFVNMSALNNAETVLMKLVAPFGSVGDEDEINISLDLQAEIVTAAISLYRMERDTPKDIINDGVEQ